MRACRCPLCGGMGLVGWEGKWNHEEPCPMCLARRYVNCRSCGGLHHRPIFVHIRSKAQVNPVLAQAIGIAGSLTSQVTECGFASCIDPSGCCTKGCLAIAVACLRVGSRFTHCVEESICMFCVVCRNCWRSRFPQRRTFRQRTSPG